MVGIANKLFFSSILGAIFLLPVFGYFVFPYGVHVFAATSDEFGFDVSELSRQILGDVEVGGVDVNVGDIISGKTDVKDVLADIGKGVLGDISEDLLGVRLEDLNFDSLLNSGLGFVLGGLEPLQAMGDALGFQAVPTNDQQQKSDNKMRIWDSTMKQTVEQLKQQLFTMLNNKAIDYISGKTDQQPKIINPAELLKERSEKAADDVISDISPGLCEPFKEPILTTLYPERFSPEYKSSQQQPLQCTINETADVKAFAEDFRNGGWPAFRKLGEPQNTPFGAFLLAFERASIADEEYKELAKWEGTMNQGFYSDKESCPIDPKTGKQDLFSPQCNVKTPGSVIKELASASFTKNFDLIANTEDLSKSISQVVSGVFNRLTSKGFNELSDKEEKSNQNLVRSIVKTTDTLEDASRQLAASALSEPIDLASNVYTEAASILESGLQRLSNYEQQLSIYKAFFDGQVRQDNDCASADIALAKSYINSELAYVDQKTTGLDEKKQDADGAIWILNEAKKKLALASSQERLLLLDIIKPYINPNNYTSFKSLVEQISSDIDPRISQGQGFIQQIYNKCK